MMEYTPEEIMKFFQSGVVPPTKQPMSFDDVWFKVDNELIPALNRKIQEKGWGVIAQAELVQGQPTPTINVAFWRQDGVWLQEFAIAVDQEGLPYFMPVARHA